MHQAQIVVSRRIPGVHGQATPITRRRLLPFSQSAVGFTEIIQEKRVAGDGLDSRADKRDGASVLSALMGRNTQQVQSIGVPRLARQDALVDALGLGQAAGLMMGERFLQSRLATQATSSLESTCRV